MCAKPTTDPPQSATSDTPAEWQPEGGYVEPVEITDEMLENIRRKREQRQQEKWEQHFAEMHQALQNAEEAARQYQEEHPEPQPIPTPPVPLWRKVVIFIIATLMCILSIVFFIPLAILAMMGIVKHPFIGYLFFRNYMRNQ